MKAMNRLRVVRADLRKTQEWLEERTKISQTRISLIERGDVDPTDDEQKSIARALRRPVTEIFPVEVAAQ